MNTIAVALFHGIGRHEPKYADAMIAQLERQFASKRARDRAGGIRLVCKAIQWQSTLQDRERALYDKLAASDPQNWRAMRQLLIDSLGDVIAYQPHAQRYDTYHAVHIDIANQLADLSTEAGPETPLCVVAHSFGSVIASNYFYDFERHDGPPAEIDRAVPLNDRLRELTEGSSLSRGQTLAMFITLGSPLALWSLQQTDLDRPITLPAPSLQARFPGLEGVWLNLYDPNDLFGYPLSPVSAAYAERVLDMSVNVGGFFTRCTPFSHCSYWTDKTVAKSIAAALSVLAQQCEAAETLVMSPSH